MENNKDNNQPNSQTAPETQSSTPPMATATPTTAQDQNEVANISTPGNKKSSNKILLVVIAIFALIVIMAIAFIILGRNMMSNTNTPAATTEITEPTATPYVSPTVTPSAENVESLDVGDPTSDLNNLDTEVNQLQ